MVAGPGEVPLAPEPPVPSPTDVETRESEVAQDVLRLPTPALKPPALNRLDSESPGSKEFSASTSSAYPQTHQFQRSNLIRSNREKRITSTFEFKSELGQGGFGSVCQGKDKISGTIWAIKTIEIHRAEQMEIDILKKLDHPNIVSLFSTYEDSKNVYLVMELCEGGELFDRIVTEKKFSEQDAVIIMEQILKAVNYLHMHEIAHRDLKPENFLYKSTDKDSPLKLIDFGLSVKFVKGRPIRTQCGTAWYISPQVVLGSYDHKADVWSCGVIMYVLLCGKPPFWARDDREVLQKIKRGAFSFPEKDWQHVSGSATDLICLLLEYDPATRPEAQQALSDAWFLQNRLETPKVNLDIADRLQLFCAQSTLKKAALTVIARNLTYKEILNLKSTFNEIDKDSNGMLTYQELVSALQEHKVPIPSNLYEVMCLVDSDGSGQIDYTEFIAATIDSEVYKKREVIWHAFLTFDLDGDGRITAAELSQALSANDTFGERKQQQIEAMITEADTDGDGSIDFDEFVAMMDANPSQRQPNYLRAEVLCEGILPEHEGKDGGKDGGKERGANGESSQRNARQDERKSPGKSPQSDGKKEEIKSPGNFRRAVEEKVRENITRWMEEKRKDKVQEKVEKQRLSAIKLQLSLSDPSSQTRHKRVTRQIKKSRKRYTFKLIELRSDSDRR